MANTATDCFFENVSASATALSMALCLFTVFRRQTSAHIFLHKESRFGFGKVPTFSHTRHEGFAAKTAPQIFMEEQKFPFFRICGAVGLIPKNIEHNSKIFNELKTHCVCFFPQGQLAPQNQRPLVFKRGIEDLIEILHPVQIVNVALHIEPLQFMKPTALIKATGFITSGQQKVDGLNLAALTERNLDDVSGRWVNELYTYKTTERRPLS